MKQKKLINTVLFYFLIMVVLAGALTILHSHISSVATDVSVDATISAFNGNSTTTQAMATQTTVSKVANGMLWGGIVLFVYVLIQGVIKVNKLFPRSK